MFVVFLTVFVIFTGVTDEEQACELRDLRTLFANLVSTKNDLQMRTEENKKRLVEEVVRIKNNTSDLVTKVRALASNFSEIDTKADDMFRNLTDLIQTKDADTKDRLNTVVQNLTLITRELNSLLTIADGGWSSWSNWTECAVTCLGGLIRRTRVCHNLLGLGCTGNSEEIDICNSYMCPDTDDCLGDVCQNGATCVDGVYEHTCNCATGYTGEKCEIDLDECISQPCQNDAMCVDGGSRYSCQCSAGFTGTNCETDIDYCVGHTCSAGRVCVDGVSSYSCVCPMGYTGASCETVWPECSRSSSILHCNCTVECPYAEDEVMCNCSTGYSNEFVTIPNKVISGYNIGGTYIVVSNAEECMQLCVNTTGCVNSELQKTQKQCYLNYVSPFMQPASYWNDTTYDFYYRKCICAN